MNSIVKKTKRLMLLTFVLMLSRGNVTRAQGHDDPYRKGKIIDSEIWVPEKVNELRSLTMKGPFVRLDNGDILSIGRTKSFISRDKGKTWDSYDIFANPDEFSIRPEHVLLKTSRGVIILAFLNDKERSHWKWDKSIHDSPGATIPIYTIRSLDGGKTWQDLRKLHNDWTGAIRDIKETNDGSIVISTQIMRHHPGHHAVITYTSKDGGKNWIGSNVIDLGGSGSHGGVFEATLVQLRDQRLWMLIRTNWGNFWQAFSNNDGLTWKNISPSNIDASSSPGILKRLQSGRLVLVWNRLYPEGKKESPLWGGDSDLTALPVSWHRQELSIMFSDDDGNNWSKPVVIARAKKGKQVAYPFIFEFEPGELWITTMFGGLKIKLFEKDFIK